MPTLHALFTAVNRYPDPSHELRGCLNDLRETKAYLTEYFRQRDVPIRSLVLEDEQATRQNVIDGFSHFDAAEDGDLCLFFFAGHGSRSPAPEVFKHLSQEDKLESLVYYDSRQPGGHDLMDKELSYLLWRATHGKDVHFLVITDCCHSGSSTRKMENVRVRNITDHSALRPAEDYLGFQFYTKAGENQYTPPRGRYIHLAACRNDQVAKEVRANGVSRGIFSCALLEILQLSYGHISYAELIGRVNILVRTKFGDQSPQIDAPQAFDKNLLFLSGISSPSEGEYLVGYDQALGWMVHVGALHGLEIGEGENSTTLELTDQKRKLTVTEVQVDRSKVSGMDQMDRTSVYKARIVQRAGKKHYVAYSSECEEAGKELLEKAIAEDKSGMLELTAKPLDALYALHAHDRWYLANDKQEVEREALFITHPSGERPLFRPILGYTEENAQIFLQNTRKALRWKQVLDITNPDTRIRNDEIAIELYRITDPGNDANDAPGVAVEWRPHAEFPYLYDGRKWCNPGFQFRVRNTGKRTLWVSLLYLGDDFSIKNQLLPKEKLEPGQEKRAVEMVDGVEYYTILMQMDDIYRQWGMSSIDNYLKLIVGTEEFDTDDLTQKGLELERVVDRTRAQLERSVRTSVGQDWRVWNICLQINRPLEATVRCKD